MLPETTKLTKEAHQKVYFLTGSLFTYTIQNYIQEHITNQQFLYKNVILFNKLHMKTFFS